MQFFRFVLYGIVAYGFEHYVAHIRRSENNWETHNNLKEKIIKLTDKKTKRVYPHLLIYIKI